MSSRLPGIGITDWGISTNVNSGTTTYHQTLDSMNIFDRAGRHHVVRMMAPITKKLFILFCTN